MIKAESIVMHTHTPNLLRNKQAKMFSFMNCRYKTDNRQKCLEPVFLMC